MKRSMALTAASVLLVWGCSLDYEDAMIKETMAESIPDVVLSNVQHNLLREGKVTGRLEASRAVQYEKKNQTLLEDVHYREMDDEGAVQTEIWADRATWHSDTEDAEASGNIYVRSLKDEGEVFAPSLTWKKQDRLLAAGDGEEVVLRRDDGSELRGTGFNADFRRNEIRLRAARGVYVYEEGDEDGDGGDDGGEDGETAVPPEP